MTIKFSILVIGLLFCPSTNHSYDKYEGTKVEKLLRDINSDIESKYFIDEPPGVLVGIKLNLKDGSRLTVYLGRLKHVKGENMERDWNWEEIKKERIRSIDCD